MLCTLLAAACVPVPGSSQPYNPANSYFYEEQNFLNYKVIGDGAIRIVLLHGFGASLENWSDIVPYFNSAQFTLILVDLKGSGFSSKPEDSDYSMVEQARIIGRLLTRINISNYYLVGHSFGGGVALLATLDAMEAHDYPLPRGLILMDAAAYKTELPFFVQYLRVPILRDLLPAVLPADFQAEYTLKKIVYDPAIITPELINRYAFFMAMDGYSQALVQVAQQIVPQDLDRYTEQYKDIAVDTLVLWGRQDPTLPLRSGVQLAETLPNGRLVILEQCGHDPLEEHSGEVAGLVLDFIDGIENK